MKPCPPKRGLEGNSWWPLVPAVLAGMLGVRVAAEFRLIGAMPSAAYLVPCLLFLFKDVIAEVQYLFAAMRWREAVADRLRRRDGREREKASYAWCFDPRLTTWTLLGAGALCTVLLAWRGGVPVSAIGLIGAGLALFGAALLRPQDEGT